MAGIDEKKRSKEWTVATTASTIVIVLVAAYLLAKMFMTNPLQGTWSGEDRAMMLAVQSSGAAVVTLLEVGEASDVEVQVDYTLDKDAKLIAFHADESNLEELAQESGGKFTKAMLQTAVNPILREFDYNVDDGQLALTEREYGGQMVFVREE